ncbi:bifunctional sulfate adenylyltransferase/adenylylsulfate kinase [Motiliproteus sp. SC1-56]|uniref:bifunctional sulfate adenylyltransferase/adenylylsulfate kinase n=1 Tax=Motiliproteus sp. SC1-56 TaxID=2799565 RepID=UPI001A8C7938|nr:bifunctional sulfate adenylyltransferase/adenylylsulfate kinase [Motiliproteus sp. SC1-56]
MLISPYGGTLNQLYVTPERAEQLKAESRQLPSWDLTPRQLCDIELLLNGAFSPLNGFMGRADYDAVVQGMRLADGTLWPLPVTLDISDALAAELAPGMRLALRDAEGVLIAILSLQDLWQPDRHAEAQQVFGTQDCCHPGVAQLLERNHSWYAGGTLEGVEAPNHVDFVTLRQTPRELRAQFEKWGWRRIAAFQTRNPMHRAHQELTFRAAKEAEANLLIHPVVGLTKPGDIDHYTRVRCYEKVLKRYPDQTAALSLLPLSMRMGGPREALLHAIIRRNYGCTHLIVGRDHAGPGKDSNGEDFYGPYEAQALMKEHAEELGIKMIPFEQMVYVRERAEYAPASRVHPDETVLAISGTEFRRRLREGYEIPEWFSYPDVVEELRKTHPPKARQGFTVFFTGLSGSGKSTIANGLLSKLLEIGGRAITLLDGDVVRKHLSSELGFSREHRNLNILRIGFVASEITKNGGIAICAPIAPYASTRREVREMIEAVGGFIEVHINTPLEVCEERDRKGLYAKARAGLIKEFTGISDPYETPETPEMRIDTTGSTPEKAVQEIVLKLINLGYIK